MRNSPPVTFSRKINCRVIFMGTSTFAIPALQALIDAGFDVPLVITAPPAKAGRSQKMQRSPVHILAESLGLNVETPDKLRRNTLEIFQSVQPDAIVVASYGLIVPQFILDLPRIGCFNIHPSILPRWRGAAPIVRTILAGDTETGVAIMRMDAGLDTGDVLHFKRVQIADDQTARDLAVQLAELGAQMLIDVLVNPQSFAPQKQNQDGVTYAHKVKKEEGLINWSGMSAASISLMIRALTPWPGVYFEHNGECVHVLEVEVVHGFNAEPGTILSSELIVQCAEGAIWLRRVQRPGRKPTSGKDYMNGLRLRPGARIDG